MIIAYYAKTYKADTCLIHNPQLIRTVELQSIYLSVFFYIFYICFGVTNSVVATRILGTCDYVLKLMHHISCLFAGWAEFNI